MIREDGLRVVVTGGRAYGDWRSVHAVLDEVHADPAWGIRMLAEGGCRHKDGPRIAAADFFAWEWAQANEVFCFTCWAPWRRMGRPAGPWRNGAMLEMVKPQLLVRFPGGDGTEDCTDKARALGIEVLDVAKQ